MKKLARTVPAGVASSMVVIEEGPLWVGIERLINTYGIDLIIAGTRGLGARPEPFLGSGAEQIFRNTTCPALTMGPAAEGDDLFAIEFKNVLFVTDFGPSAERALPYTVSLAHKYAARVTFLHVVEDDRAFGQHVLEHLRQIHVQRMKHALAANHGFGIEACFCVRFGKPADEILNEAHEMSADLIIMGAKASSAWAGHVPLSTAYNVVARASCPVLTVRA